MIESSPASGVDPVALRNFMKQVRTTLGRDLRTSLGTIVNYASVLDEEEVRDLPRRIRGEAMQSAEMLQLLLDATLLAASLPALVPVDPNALLRSVVAEISGEASVREPVEPPAPGEPTIELEPEIVSFVWRAFLLLENSLLSRPLAAARATVDRDEEQVRIGLTFPTPPGAAVVAANVDLDAFVRNGAIELPASRCYGLRLARDLVAARGGKLELRGRFGTDAAIFMSFPASI